MAKDAYYFFHDSNAKDDPKCVLLIEQLGMEGYGIFWVLVETLRDQPEYKYPMMLIPALARRYNTTAEKVKTVVMQYGLFQIENDEFFYSESLNNRMLALEKRREQRVLAGRKSAQKRLSINEYSTTVERPLNDRSTSRVEKSREEENIDNTPYSPPRVMETRFEQFWKAYPRKVGRGAAEKAFKKYKPDELLLSAMLQAVSAQKQSEQWLKDGGQYVPNPATWLNQMRWEDESPDQPRPPTPRPKYKIVKDENGKEVAIPDDK